MSALSALLLSNTLPVVGLDLTDTYGDNPISRLSDDQKKALLSASPPTPSGQSSAIPHAVASSIDWTSYRRKNYVTSVKQQVGATGLAFADTAVVESAAIRSGLADDIDLSEHAMVSCNPNYPAERASFLAQTGLPQEACYPFTPASGDCSTACSQWQDKTYRPIVHKQYHSTVKTISDIRKILNKDGPVAAVIKVPWDFFYYNGGIYTNLLNEGVTPTKCLETAKRVGKTYAGLQYGGQCFAGNVKGYAQVGESECGMPCDGDSSKTCGGTWRNSLYSVADGKYVGCFVDQPQRALELELSAPVGFHAVAIVGIHEGARIFKAKNSWGAGWGEDGYVNISYDEFKSRMVGIGGLVDSYANVMKPPIKLPEKTCPGGVAASMAGCPSGSTCVEPGGSGLRSCNCLQCIRPGQSPK